MMLMRFTWIYQAMLWLALLALPAWAGVPYSSAGFRPVTAPPPLVKYTVERNLKKALVLLQQTLAGQRSWRRIQQHGTKILFKDLGQFGPEVGQFDAMGWMGPNQERVIFVHEKHRGELPEALAALIAHEALHDDAWNSKAEEVAAWHQEASVWLELQAQVKQAQRRNSPLEARLDRLIQEKQLDTLEALVRRNNAYKKLPENSPGFN